MSPDATAEHLSIGEVLAQIQDEFPEITISKIRFLESQGLIDPQRTPSGYRRFYAPDVERLRWILFQQREHFLPLRIIKARLDDFGPLGAPPPISGNGAEPGAPLSSPSPPSSPASRRGEPKPKKVDATRVRPPRPPAAPTLPLGEPDPRERETRDRRTRDRAPRTTTAPDVVSGGDHISRAELLERCGLSDAALDDLETYGLVTPATGSGEHATYDDDTVEIAQVAAEFASRGIGARHLRMYVHEAEREAGLFAQVLLPYRRKRNPAASARLTREREDLLELGRRLRAVTLERAMRGTVTE